MRLDDGLHTADAREPIEGSAESGQYHDPPFNGIEVTASESPELHRIPGIGLQHETEPGFGRAKTNQETYEKPAFKDVRVEPRKRKNMRIKAHHILATCDNNWTPLDRRYWGRCWWRNLFKEEF